MFSNVWASSDNGEATENAYAEQEPESIRKGSALGVGRMLMEESAARMPSLSDVLSEMKGVREDLKRLYWQQTGDATMEEHLSRAIEDAFTKQKWLHEATPTGKMNLVQELDKVLSGRLRDQNSAMCELMRQVIADEVKTALSGSVDSAVENALQRSVHIRSHDSHDVASTIGAAIADTESRLLEEMQKMEVQKRYSHHHSKINVKRNRLPSDGTMADGTALTSRGSSLTERSPRKVKSRQTTRTSTGNVVADPTTSWFLNRTDSSGSLSSGFKHLALNFVVNSRWSEEKVARIRAHFHVWWLSQIVFNFWFRLFFFLCTVVNMIYIAHMQSVDVHDALDRHGVHVNWNMQGTPEADFKSSGPSTSYDDHSQYFHHTHDWEIVFTIFFLIMLSLCFVASPHWFLFGHGRKYYVLDAMVVLAFAVDLLICAILGHVGEHVLPNLTFLLLVHSINDLFEALEKFQVTHFLRAIIKGATHSLVVVWAVLAIILMLCYFFGTVLLHGILNFLRTQAPGSVDQKILTKIAEFYGSMPVTLLSLSMGITGGLDWREVIEPLGTLPSFYTLWAFAFQAFAIFGLLNVTTAIFVDYSFQITDRNKHEQIRKKLSAQAQWEKKIIEVFNEADKDDSGTLTWEEFRSHMEHPIIVAYFDSLELDITEAQGLFTLLDVNARGDISVHEFVKGCAQLKGDAKSLDLATLRYEFLHFSIHYMRDMEIIKRKLAKQSSQIQELIDDDSESEIGDRLSSRKLTQSEADFSVRGFSDV